MRPLTVAQQGLWSGYLLNEDQAMFNTAECIAFAGQVQAPLLLQALCETVAECEALAGYYQRQAEVVGFVPATLPLVLVELQVPAQADAQAWVRQWAAEDIRQPFDLEREAGCRFALLRAEQGDFLYACIHHIALDGYGCNLLFQRVAERYMAALRSEPAPACPFGKLDAVLAEDAARAASGRVEAARDYWLEQLRPLPEPASFSERRAPISANFVRHSALLPAELGRRLAGFAEAQRLGWPDLLLAALATQLAQVGGEAVQVFGLMVMNRIGSNAFDVPCMQMNIAPLCLALDDALDLAGSARAIARQRRADRPHQHYRYESLRRDLGRVGGEQRLFGPLVNIMPFDRPQRFGDVAARTLNLSAGPVEDLTIEVHPGADGSLLLEYDGNPGCYRLEELQALSRGLFELLSCWLERPTLGRAALLGQWSANARAAQLLTAPPSESAPPAGGVLQQIARQAVLQPQRLALCQGAEQLSYAELQAQVEQIAAGLLRLGVLPGQRVGVMLGRSPDAILAALGVLAAGAVYVPLDPQQPAQRQRLICTTAQLVLLISEAALRPQVAGFHDGPVVLAGQLRHASRSWVLREAGEAAYLMFTSGSSGQPKAVEVSHGALAAFVAGARQRYGVGLGERVLQFAPFSFDASIEEIFVSLASGATLVLRDDAMLESMPRFVEELERLRISVLDLPTAFWNEWVVALRAGLASVPACLRCVIIGGEAAYPEQLAAWQAAAPNRVRLVNSYGPTEATVVATTCDLQSLPAKVALLPIGVPLAGVQALVLGRGDLPASEGELVLCGAQLASGYLNSDSPAFGELAIGALPQRVYRTGDRVRLEQGQLFYLGRLDNEFKISGQRIQPGEVEAQLLALDGVDEACVLGLELPGGLRRLVAFVAGAQSDTRALRHQLAQRLPAAMLPSDWRHQALLPRTGSNKIDRRQLQQAYLAASGEAELDDATQQRVARIWQQILGVVAIAAQDNFFELGGQSLQTIQIVNRLAGEFGVRVKVSDVFDHPRLADFCRFLEASLSQREDQVELVW